ncbi:MAG: MlaD family protein [Bacteroidota bacterium]
MEKKSIRVGLSVIAAILIIYLFLSWTQQSHFFGKETTLYQLHFPEIDGLLEGDPVFIRGYEVGKVTDIQLLPSHMQVRIGVDAQTQLFHDARAEIMMKDLMGAKAISLFPGSSQERLDPATPIIGRGGADWGKLMNSVTTLASMLEKEDVNGWLRKSEKLLDQLSQGTQLLTSDTVRTLLLSLSNASIEAEVMLREARAKGLTQQLINMLESAENLSIKMDSLATSLQPFASALAPGLIQKSDTALTQLTDLLERTESLLTEGESFLSALNNQEGLLGRSVYDQSLSTRFDSTLSLFEEVLIRLKDERIRVGIALSKEKESTSRK